MSVEELLKELAGKLSGLNYGVTLRLYRMPFTPGAGAEHYVVEALGPAAVVGGWSSPTGQQVLEEVEEALLHPGAFDYGPRLSTLRSRRFKELLRKLLAHVEQAAAAANFIERFWLEKGHPDYPVYWDFAFVMAGPLGAEVFLGSSSD